MEVTNKKMVAQLIWPSVLSTVSEGDVPIHDNQTSQSIEIKGNFPHLEVVHCSGPRFFLPVKNRCLKGLECIETRC